MNDVIPGVALIDNSSQRLPCILVLDGSGSMDGKAITELNAGLKVLEEELKLDDIARNRVRLLVLRVGDPHGVEIVTDWTDAVDFTAPTIHADGMTPLGAGVRRALSELTLEKRRYDAAGIAYNRPWLYIFTDGEPSDPDWATAAAECAAAERENRVVVFPIAVGDASLDKLGQFSSARVPVVLDGIKFREMFKWLSRSAKAASRSAQGESVQMPSPAGWAMTPT